MTDAPSHTGYQHIGGRRATGSAGTLAIEDPSSGRVIAQADLASGKALSYPLACGAASNTMAEASGLCVAAESTLIRTTPGSRFAGCERT